MPRIPVVDDIDRREIRFLLEIYMKKHRIGVPTLVEHMKAKLEVTDSRYIDLKSLQRFLSSKSKIRTSDEKVWRYKKFVEIEIGTPDAAQIIGKAMHRNMVFPTNIELRPLAELAGTYELKGFEYGAGADAKPTGSDVRYVRYFSGNSSPYYLSYFDFQEEENPEAPGEKILQYNSIHGVLTRGSVTEFMMLRTSWTGTAFGLFREVESDPLTLVGNEMVPDVHSDRYENVRQIRLTRIPDTDLR